MPAGTNPFTGAEVHPTAGTNPFTGAQVPATVLREMVMVAVPATATSPGTAGDIARDNSFFYICTAPNTWRRVAVAAWE